MFQPNHCGLAVTTARFVRAPPPIVCPSWREVAEIERLPLDFDDYDRFASGDSVVVGR